MFSAEFDKETIVDSEIALRSLFRTDKVYLEPGSSVVFSGEIVLEPSVILGGKCRFQGPIHIAIGCHLRDVTLGPGSLVRAYSLLYDVMAGYNNTFGPFCFIRDNCIVANYCIIGSHVEAARSEFKSGVKISHRAFVGDAEVGENSIIGAGVTFCNFDGERRQVSIVGACVIIGSGTILVSPLSIGDRAVIAAGSAVIKDIGPDMKLIQRRYSE